MSTKTKSVTEDESKVSVFVKLHQKLNIARAAGIVAVASIPLGCEAVVVFISSNLNEPEGELSGDSNTFPPGLKYTAAAFEAFMFITGIFLAFASTFFGVNSPTLTGICAVISALCGTFYFCVITLAEPIFNFEKELVPPLAPLGGWDTEYRRRVVFWLGSFIPMIAVALLSFGWHFTSILNLYRCQTDLEANSDPKYNKLRYLLFSFFDFVLGIGMITAAGWTREQEGPDQLSQMVIYLPNVIVWPDVAVMTGTFVVAYGVVNSLHACAMLFIDQTWSSGTLDLLLFLYSTFIKLLSFAAFAWLVGFHTMMQISLASPTLAGPGAQVALLMIPIVFSPIWFMTEAERVKDKKSLTRSIASIQKVEMARTVSQEQLAQNV